MADADSDSGENPRNPIPVLHGVTPDFSFHQSHQYQHTDENSHVPLESTTHHPPTNAGPSPSSNNTGHIRWVPFIPQPVVRPRFCHHSVVERQYCMDQYEICDSCGRSPFLGWLYACTVDTSGFSAPMDRMRGPFLSPWILRAIESGQYTVEEREVLIQQKLNVMRTADLERNPSSPSLSIIEEVDEYAEEHEHSGFSTNQTNAPLPQSGPSSYMYHRPLPPPPCTFRACRQCERRFGNLAERAWMSINEVCNDPTIEPPALWELVGRPMSNTNVVRNLGLRPLAVPYPEDNLFGYTVTDSHEDVSILEFYAQENMTNLDLNDISDLVDQSLAISETDDNREDGGASIHTNESGQSVLLEMSTGVTSVGEKPHSTSGSKHVASQGSSGLDHNN